MITLLAIALPSLLVTLALEVHDGRLGATAAGLDGGIAIALAAIVAHAGDIL